MDRSEAVQAQAFRRTLEYRPGEIVIRQDERGRGFYVLEEGSLEVLKDDVLLAVLTYEGTIFGEMGDILNKPRSCTVRAKSAVRLTHKFYPTLHDLIVNEPGTAAQIIETLANRLERTTRQLVNRVEQSSVWSTQEMTKPD